MGMARMRWLALGALQIGSRCRGKPSPLIDTLNGHVLDADNEGLLSLLQTIADNHTRDNKSI